jgi:CDP-glucose 4,6-dehydratase
MVASQPMTWTGKRVLVTGHTGFKGAWLSLWLQRLGATVTGYALAPPTTPSLFEQARVADAMQSIIADVRDLTRLTEVVRDARPDVIFHLAAQSLVRAGYDDPIGTYATNVMGTAHVLEAARGSTARAIVIVTTDKCYDNREWLWGYREVDRLGGRDPYSSSKACAELVVASFRDSVLSVLEDARGLGLATARAGNVIGGGDWGEDRLVADAVRAVEAGTGLHVRHPFAVRPWQHVLSPLAGYLRLCEALCEDAGAAARAWNFGPQPQDERPVGWVVERLAELWQGELAWSVDDAANPPEAGHLALDSAAAEAGLGWRPACGLEDGLRLVVEWHRAQRGGEDMRAVSLAQIESLVS